MSIKYFIVKEFKNVDGEWYSKDVSVSDLMALGDYMESRPKQYKFEIRVVRDISSTTDISCVSSSRKCT